MYQSDIIIAQFIRKIRELLENVKETNPEQIDRLMRVIEEVFGVVLNNECEIDALLEILESGLHYYQVQIGLEKGASIEQLTELSKHNARKIAIGVPTVEKELVLKEAPNYSFDTSREVSIQKEGMPLPKDYCEKYIIGTHFRKPLYNATLERQEEGKETYHVNFQRKDWIITITPVKELVVLNEFKEVVDIESYLLIEVRRELGGLTDKKTATNQ